MNSGKVILGAIAGLATGAILGILFAPEKGTDTRKKIAKKSKDSIDDIKSKYDAVIESLSAKLASVKKDASHLFEEGKDFAQESKRDGSKLYEEGKDLAHDAKIRATNQIK
jgi:gas vesicle protein